MRTLLWALAAVAAVAPVVAPVAAQTPAPDIQLFFQAAARDGPEADEALRVIGAGWRDGYAGLIIDLARFFPSSRRPAASGPAEALEAGDGENPLQGRPPGGPGLGGAPAPLPPGAQIRARLVRFLEKQTGERFGDDLGRWRRWLWSRPHEPHPDYPAFKAALYAQVDPRMAEFFRPGGEYSRMDSVQQMMCTAFES